MANKYIEQQLLQKRRSVYLKKGKWIIHSVVIIVMFFSSISSIIRNAYTNYPTIQAIQVGVLINLPFLISFYFYCLYMVPVFFKTNKYKIFWLWLIVLLVIVPLVDFGWARLLTNVFPILKPKEPSSIFKQLLKSYTDFISDFMVFLSVLYVMELLEGIRTSKEIIVEEKQLAVTELQMIKTQINPDFIVRSLDRIIQLSELNDQKTPGAVVNFSDVLRYRLYRSNQKLVPLADELQQLSNLFTFQNTIPQQENLATLDVEGNATGKFIPPLSFVNIAELLFGTFEMESTWSLLFYLLVEENELQIAIELQANNDLLMISKIKKIQYDLSLLWRTDLTFNTEKQGTNYSLRICLPNLANSTALS